MKTSYYTILKEGKGEFKDRGSKFIGLAFYIQSREDSDHYLHQVKKEYYDARHHCTGLVLGIDGAEYFSSDDGEPAHSAGDPILGQIKSRGLTNTLVIVVRYFGGTKLGVPGLINAYRSAADLALKEAGQKEVEITFKVEVQFPYTSTPFIEKLIHKKGLTISEQSFTDICKFILSANISLHSELFDDLETMKQREQILNFTEIPE